MADKKWLITLSGERPINALKNEIAALGFKVEQVLTEIGCITGSCSEAIAKKIRKLNGIADVSQDAGEFSIGPPDAPVTW